MNRKQKLIDYFRLYKLVFWDFDGVIKESVDIKTSAFVKLFDNYDNELHDRIREHHRLNSGISRYEKIPLYISWSGEEPTKDKVSYLINKFSEIVINDVINCPWVPGVLDILKLESNSIYVLVSATPEEEIKNIVKELEINSSFEKVYGSPKSKNEIINDFLTSSQINRKEALFIGDAMNDYEAAKFNNIDFLLRKTKYNKEIQNISSGLMFNDFISFE